MKPKETSLSADGLHMLNAVCDEYRRQLKTGLVELEAEAPLQRGGVLSVAAKLQHQPWLKQFEEDESDDFQRRAA